MKLLLDTHVWIWTLLFPKRVGPRIARELVSLRNEIWLSPVSIWEALLLAASGRVRFRQDASRFLETALAEQKYHEAPLTHDVAFESRRLSLSTEDPADRLLAATAKVYDLTLVTADERLQALREIKVLPNR